MCIRDSSYEVQKKLKSLQNRLSKLEAAIATLEKDIKAIDFELEINYETTVAAPNFFDVYQAKKTELERLMLQWENLTESIEQHNWWKNIFTNVPIAGNLFLF